MTDDPRACPIVWAPLIVMAAFLVGCGGPPPAIREKAAWTGHDREVQGLAFAPDGKTLASSAPDAVKVWDVATGREIRSFPMDGSEMGGVAFSPDGRALATIRAAKGAVAWDPATGRERAAYDYPPAKEGFSCYSVSYGWGIAYAPDGRTLAGGGTNRGEDGFVTLWDTATGAGVNFGEYGSPVTTVAYRPDGRTIAAGSLAGPVNLWDAATRTRRLSIPASRSYMAPVVFSPDGRALAIAHQDRSVRLWDADTGRETGSLRAHLKAVLGLAYHPDGRTLATGDSGGTLYLWDIPRRQPIARLVGHPGKIWAIAFSPDGKTLASAGEDRVIRLWDVAAAVASSPGR